MAIIPSTAKVLNQYENVNTTYGGSKAMKAQSKWYTMQDVEDTINANKPYKVFTALLTQGGGYDQISINGGDLTIGVTYFIDDPAGGDWTNVGAPNNDTGTYFIATGTTPNAWDDGTLFYNTGAPVATVLENTIGNVWFVYDAIGRYILASNELFVDNKTAKFGGWANLDLGTYFRFSSPGDNNNAINLSTGDPANANGYLENLSATIEIRVYN